VKILHRYLFTQVAFTTLVAVTILTALVVLGNVFQRIFELLVNNDVPFWTLAQMVLLLFPQAFTFTLPWGLLVGVLLVFGRMSHELELQAVRSAGIGLLPFVAPVVLFSLAITMLCFFNNAVLAPDALYKFKQMVFELTRNNPTAFLRAQEPIDRFSGYRIYLEKKYGNSLEGIYIWELDDNGVPQRSIRADKGTIDADLRNQSLNILLTNARVENRGKDSTDVKAIQTGIYARSFPFSPPLEDILKQSGIKNNISLKSLGDLNQEILTGGAGTMNFIPLLTELQRRFAFAFAPFTLALIGIPLALTTQRKETSIGFVMSLGVIVIYYLLIVVSKALEQKAAAYPEFIVWLPNIAFQAVGFYMLWKANRQPL